MTTDYKRVGDLIDRIEMKIDSGLATPEYLENIQQQLRDLPVPQKGQDHRYSQYINELRALTYQAFGKDSDALKYIHAALDEAGSVKKLHSSMLQKYVLKNHLVVSEHKTSSAPQTKPTKLDMLDEAEQSFMNNVGLGQGQDIDLLFRTPKKFALMYILSGGRYEWYWVYKNWQAIQIASGRKASPFWRTFFNIFYIWPLFKSMTLLAKSRGYKGKLSGGWLAAGYILINVLTLTVGFYTSSKIALALAQIILIGTSTVAYILEQRAVAFVVLKQPDTKSRPVNYVEWLFVIVGALLTIWFIYHNYFHTTHLPSAWQQINTQHTK